MHNTSMLIYAGRGLEKNEDKRTEWAEIREAEFLVVARAAFWPTPALTEGTFESSAFSAEDTFISASSVPCHHPDITALVDWV